MYYGSSKDKDKGLFPPKPSRRDVMVPMFGTQSVMFWYPHVLPPIPYSSTTSQPLPTPIPNPKREGERGGSARPSATIASHPRRLRLSVARPSDGPPRLRGRPICEKQLTTTLYSDMVSYVNSGICK